MKSVHYRAATSNICIVVCVDVIRANRSSYDTSVLRETSTDGTNELNCTKDGYAFIAYL